MQLARPEWLWFLAAVPLLAVSARRSRARRARGWSALGQGGRPPRDGSTLRIAAAVALSLALAGPRWGASDAPPLPPGHDVVIALDVSRSMAARDAVPDRLGVAVESAEGLIAALGREPGDRVAVVAFAGRGVLRCPLTRDLAAAVEALRSLRPGAVTPGGTDLGAGLDAALDAFDDLDHDGGRAVVVFSDGEDHPGHWLEAAGRLRDRGVIAHTVAVGDPEVGHPIPSRPGRTSEPIRYQGTVVLSRRSDEPLRAIARSTGGAFVPLGLATTDMGRLYQARIEPGARVVRRAALITERRERFPVFLVAALAFTLAASVPVRPRLPIAHGLVASLAVSIAAAAPRNDPGGVVAEGLAAYEAGRYAQALESFRVAVRLAPGDPVPIFDAASALFQLGRFDEAQDLYQETRRRAGAALRAKVDYALGNTAAARGDFPAAIRHYDDCLASNAPGPGPDRVRRDAAVNRQFVVEQARRPQAPPDPGSDPNPNPPPGTSPQEAPSKDGKSPGAGNGSGNPADAPPGKRGAGGAGGGGLAQPQPGSPEQQLSEALENVREARRGRIEETSAADDRAEGKDW